MTNRQTKWTILQARAEALREELALAEHRMGAMENTDCGLYCDSCNLYLSTEADFAKHFTVPDARYLNLGDCPFSHREPNRWA